VHALADVQDTESRVLLSPPAGGVGTTVQVLPFQDSASAAPDDPVAMQAVALTQDTASRVPPTFGMGMTVHDVPSQASASVLGSGLRRVPTATHDDRDVQDTAVSAPCRTAAVVWVIHVLPFQRSTLGGWPGPVAVSARAVHAEADEQDTWESRLAGVRALGLGWTVQDGPAAAAGGMLSTPTAMRDAATAAGPLRRDPRSREPGPDSSGLAAPLARRCPRPTIAFMPVDLPGAEPDSSRRSGVAMSGPGRAVWSGRKALKG
jgi:hypothetical protein